MAPSDQSRNSLVPGFLYSSKTLSHLNTSSINNNHGLPPSTTSSNIVSSSSPSPSPLMIPSPNESIRLFSPSYYAACSAGGVFSCGLTHMAVTPLDLVKCNMQVGSISFPMFLSVSFHYFSSRKIAKNILIVH